METVCGMKPKKFDVILCWKLVELGAHERTTTENYSETSKFEKCTKNPKNNWNQEILVLYQSWAYDDKKFAQY